MQNNFISIFAPKRDSLFDAAMVALNATKILISIKKGDFENIDLDDNLFHKVFPRDPQSPSIYFIDKSQYLIFYPANSTPYAHKYENKCKFIEVLSGKLFDANSDKKFFKGDKLKVEPKDNYAPYTTDEKCVLRVCVRECNSLFDQICK